MRYTQQLVIIASIIGILTLCLSIGCMNKSYPDVFCEIIAGKSPATFIDRGEHELVMAIEKRRLPNGQFRPHIDFIIITKKHIVQFDDNNPEHKKIRDSMDRMLEKLKNMMIDPDSVTTHINLPGPGQEVPHVHMHVKGKGSWKNPTWRTQDAQ
jgi:diadenosine tetraphosphate (Ap4A) HIT family hydrolase